MGVKHCDAFLRPLSTCTTLNCYKLLVSLEYICCVTLSSSNTHFRFLFSLAVGADAGVHVLEALELELWLILCSGCLLHLDELNSFFVGLSLLRLGEGFALLSL